MGGAFSGFRPFAFWSTLFFRIEFAMPLVLAFNPGSASLKFELIEVHPEQTIASEGRKLLSASIEGIGKQSRLLIFEDHNVVDSKPCPVHDMRSGAAFALEWLRQRDQHSLQHLDLIGVRVVHGGSKYQHPARLIPEVRSDIESLEELAPLHNKSSLEIFDTLNQKLPHLPIYAAFDTSFHATLPEHAWRYPIQRDLADRFAIRKYGFHGFSHRYMLEQYAHDAGKRADQVTIITLHLESGSSAAAICQGRSIDTTMGLTPLEGLMMGTRSGSIDPAIVPLLMRKLGTSADDVMHILNHQSGLIGIAGGTFDTRDLVKRIDPAAQLALEMFSYRIRLAIGGYLAVLGNTEAVIFGGGIGEDTPLVRAQVCRGLASFGLNFDEEANTRSTSGPARLSRPGSRLDVFVIPTEEGLQIAHECVASSA